MIIGVGIDSIEIERFAHWHHFSKKLLLRLFSEQEIAYCLESKPNGRERFAAHFAAREAFFKAIQTAYPTNYLPFLSLCRAIELTKAPNGSPMFTVDWDMLRRYINPLGHTPPSALISITHTKTIATAYVLLQT